MKPSSHQTEVILFYIDDKDSEIENILPGFTFNRNIKPTEMLDLCVKSIKKSMPGANVILITNSSTSIHNGIDNIHIINADNISHEKLIYDLHAYRRQYIESKIGLDVNLIFTDIDVLINEDLTVLFDQEFDLATTIDPFSNLNLSDKGLPTDSSLMFNFTGGIYFVKCNENTLKFYDYFLAKWNSLATSDDFSAYGVRANEIQTHFLRWWGELHTFSVIFGTEILNGRVDRATFNHAKWLFLPEKKYNFAPKVTNSDGKMSINVDGIQDAGVIHFRGIRKVFMPLVFKKFFAN